MLTSGLKNGSFLSAQKSHEPNLTSRIPGPWLIQRPHRQSLEPRFSGTTPGEAQKRWCVKLMAYVKTMGKTVEFGFSGSNLRIRNTTMMLISVYLSAKDWMGAESDQDMWNLCHSLILTNTVIVTVVGQHIHHVSDPKAWRKSLWTWTDTTSRLCICMCIYIYTVIYI